MASFEFPETNAAEPEEWRKIDAVIRQPIQLENFDV